MRCERFDSILQEYHIQTQILQNVVVHLPAVVCTLGIWYRSTLRSGGLRREQRAPQEQEPRKERQTRPLMLLPTDLCNHLATFSAHGDSPCCHAPYLPSHAWGGTWHPRMRRARWSAIRSQQHTQPLEAACSKRGCLINATRIDCVTLSQTRVYSLTSASAALRVSCYISNAICNWNHQTSGSDWITMKMNRVPNGPCWLVTSCNYIDDLGGLRK